ncbi:uncharacterized protein LOC118196545 [Stegodyphus dumicola]|uniref:uncharacterized protein LOC118196545 n=1 Tax=Stegodyphus dumicola TaxID=202533 RepID=UPI0015AFEEBC|nr:uncharacterized protein LOC118196545 [Stegodyphus dumicola]
MFAENGPVLKTACGKTVAASGRCVLKVDLNGTKKPFEFLVFPECSHQMILGWNFFRATDAVIDCGNQELTLAEILPDIEYLNKSQLSLFAATDYVIEANTAKRICALNSELREADEAMIVGNRVLMCEKELSIPAFNCHYRGWLCDIFDFNSIAKKSRCNSVKHKIDTSDSAPIKQRPYRVSATERRVIADEVQRMLKEDVIQPSDSPWSSPVVLVKKKNGEWRFCVDYRKLNKVTKKDVYPLPRIDDALDCLAGAKLFSMMDLKSGYWQIDVDDKNREKTSFFD